MAGKATDGLVKISNPDKVLYAEATLTKADVIDYYVRVAPFLLPPLQARPVRLTCVPDGVGRPFLYKKDAPSFTPPWVRTFPVPRRHRGGDIRYIVIDDVRTLAWCANLANLEVHPSLHRVPHLTRPT